MGSHFFVITDHAPLVSLMRTKDPLGLKARIIAYLQEFTFTILHRAGLNHANVDALTRDPKLFPVAQMAKRAVRFHNEYEWAKSQQKLDNKIVEIIQCVEGKCTHKLNESVCIHRKQEYVIHRGLLFRIIQPDTKKARRSKILPALRCEIPENGTESTEDVETIYWDWERLNSSEQESSRRSMKENTRMYGSPPGSQSSNTHHDKGGLEMNQSAETSSQGKASQGNQGHHMPEVSFRSCQATVHRSGLSRSTSHQRRQQDPLGGGTRLSSHQDGSQTLEESRQSFSSPEAADHTAEEFKNGVRVLTRAQSKANNQLQLSQPHNSDMGLEQIRDLRLAKCSVKRNLRENKECSRTYLYFIRRFQTGRNCACRTRWLEVLADARVS